MPVLTARLLVSVPATLHTRMAIKIKLVFMGAMLTERQGSINLVTKKRLPTRDAPQNGQPMKSLLSHFRFEALALLAAALCLLVSPYAALLPLGWVVVRLGLRLRNAQRQQALLRREIASLERTTQHLKTQALTDSLTGLANRFLLADRFQLVLERSKRQQVAFALLMVDLNGFKIINDHFGHAAGDLVLRTVAQRLSTAVRACDTVARIGGDEFVLLLEAFEDPDELVHIGRKLIATISEEITLQNGSIIHVGASVGIGLFPRHGTDLDTLLQAADEGMYDCKASGLMELQ